MQDHLAFIVFAIFSLFIKIQAADNVTVITTVHNTSVLEQITAVSIVEPVTVEETTVPLVTSTTTNLLHKVILPLYVEPPPHPTGYCIDSRLACSKVRRCCEGPCDVNRRQCP